MFWRSREEGEAEMSKKDRVKMYRDYLQGEGFSPKLDKDGDIVFKMEGRIYIIIVDERDEEFFRIIFPNFWSIENDGERAKVERAALQATAETKVAKVFPVRDNVWASIELFLSPPEGFKPIFQRSMSALRSGVGTFVSKMRA